MKPIAFHPEASAELEEAADYYEERRTGLGAALVAEVHRCISIIQEHPQIGTPYKNKGFRRFVLDRFPYLIYYLELEEKIWIAAVAHGRRRPGYWKRRRSE